MSDSESPPDPPDSIPKYIKEGLLKQNDDTLRDISEYIDELLEWRNRPIEPAELDKEGVVDVDRNSPEGAIVIRKNDCGKDCAGCPHGPYKYHVYRKDGETIWDYKGKP